MTGVALPVLEVEDLQTVFLTDAGAVRAVDGVSFTVGPGETLGIVGESGSGKTVTALSLMRLLEEPARIVGGSIRFQGRDVLAMRPDELRDWRGNHAAMVFQDPMTGLNPVLRILPQVSEHIVSHGRQTGAAARRYAIDMLRRMGVASPERAAASFPHQYSGGMRQRVMLAIGVANDPVLLIADEPTTALDVTIQAQILDLLCGLNREFGTAIVLISHDLGVIGAVCRRVAVMYAGEIVEEANTTSVLNDPRHPVLLGTRQRSATAGHAGRRADDQHRGLAARCLEFAAGLPFRAALSVQGGEMRCRASAVAGSSARPARPLLGYRRRLPSAATGRGDSGVVPRPHRRAEAIAGNTWSGQAFPVAEDLVLWSTSDHARRQWRGPHAVERRKPWRGRRERLRQVHARTPGHPFA